MRALVSGATGLLGRHLVARLDHPKVLVRDVARARGFLGPDVEPLTWDSASPVPPGALDGVEVVFHLAGEPVGHGRLTEARKQAIFDSRVIGTRQIVEALRAEARRPKVLVSASAVGYYGSRGDEELTETSEPGAGFLADVCRAWEKEALAARELGVRVVTTRTGLVLSPQGGVLAPMRAAFRFGVGGPLGSGQQWMSWVHVDDAIGLLLHAAETTTITGPLNVCAPSPARNVEFARALGAAMHRPARFRTPAAALRLALGEMADIAMTSCRALPEKALASGYRFLHPELRQALMSVIRPEAPPVARAHA